MEYLKKFIDAVEGYYWSLSLRDSICPNVPEEVVLKMQKAQTLAEIEVLYNMIIRDKDIDVHGGFVSAQRFVNFVKNHSKYDFK
jgi:hypothetical protein